MILWLFCALLVCGCSREAKLNKARDRGKAYFDAGEFEKAKITYLGVIRSDGQNLEAIKRVGLIWSEQGVSFETIRFLIKARELDPKDVAVRAKLATAFLGLRLIADARKEAEAILLQEPEQQEALLILTETAGSEDELKALEDRLEKADGTKIGVLLARAALALRNNDLASAETILQKAIAADPKSSAAYSAMGAIALRKQDVAGAEAAFKQASALAPRTGSSIAYAKTLGQKDPKAASEFVAQFAEKHPDFLPLRTFQAQIAFADKRPDDALKLLQQVLQIDPGNFDALLLTGQVSLSKGEADKAIALLKKLSEDEFYSRVPLPKFELARAYLQKANPSQAIVALTEAVKLQPDYTEAQFLLGQLKLQQGDPQSVVDSMRALLQKRPNMLQAQLLLSQAYRSQGNLPEAARVLREQLKATPEAPEPNLLLGLILLQQGQREDARASLETVRKLSPKDLLAAYYLVELDIAEKKFDEARQRAQGLMQEMPDAAAPHYLQARVEIAQEKWAEAETALKKSIELDPNFTGAYDLLVSIYVKNKQLEQASSQTEAFLARNPENMGGLLTLAVIQEQLKNHEKARDTYQKVIDGNPNSATALNNLAVIHAERFNQLDKAYELASRARTLQPADPSIADTLGWIAYRRQDYVQAVALLRESVEKAPANAEVQFHFGMASYMSGQTEAARVALTKAAASPDDFPGKSEIPRALSMIGGGAEPQREMSNDELAAILKQQPSDIVARQRLADRLEAEGKFTEAAGLWDEALRLNSKLSLATLKLARLYAGPLQNPEKALDYAKKARALAPGDPSVTKLAGRAAYQGGHYEWAYGLLQESALQNPKDPELLHDLAWTAYNLGKVTEARRAMQRVADTPPDSKGADAARQFMTLTAAQEKPQEAATQEAAAEAALKVSPDYVPALVVRGILQMERGQKDAAIATYAGILQLLPDFAPAQKGLAMLYSETPDRSAEAFDLAVKARKNLPDDPEVARALGALRYRRKEFPTAVQLLQESASRKPLDANGLFYLGMARLQQKQKNEGFQALEQALAAGLTGSEAEEAQRALAARTNP